MANVDLHLRWLNETNDAIKRYADAANVNMGQQNSLLQQHTAQWQKTGAAQQQTHAAVQKHVKSSTESLGSFGKQVEEVGKRIASAFTLYEIEEFTRHAILAYADVDRATHYAQEVGHLSNQQMEQVRDSIDKVSAQTGEKITDLIKDYTDYVGRMRNESMKTGDVFQAVVQAAELLGTSNEDMTSAISAAINNLNLDVNKSKEQLKQWEDILPKQGAMFTKMFPKMAQDLAASGVKAPQSGTQIAAMLKVLQSQMESPQQAAEVLTKLLHRSLTDPNLELRRKEVIKNGGGALELIQMQLDYTKQFNNNPDQFRKMGFSFDEIVGQKALREGMPEVQETIEKAVNDLETSEQKAAKDADDLKGSINALTAAIEALKLAIGKAVTPYAIPGIHAATREVQDAADVIGGKKPLLHDFLTTPTPRGGMTVPNKYMPGMLGFQTGGIVTQPTVAMLGESGPEAIIPLTELKQAAAAQERSEEQQKSFKELSTMERIHQLALRTPQLAELAGGYLDPWKDMQHKPGATNWSGGDRQRMADGGVSIGPTDATIGEAGPEMRVNLNDPSKSTLVTRRTDVTLGKDGPEAIVPLGDKMPANARAFISAIGATETDFSTKEAYSDKYNQVGNNANVRKYGSVAADYGFYQMNRMDADEAVNKYGMDPMQARHLYGGVDQKSSVDDQTNAVNEYIKRRWPGQYQKLVDNGDFEGMRKTAQGTWFGLKDHQVKAAQEFKNPSLAQPAASPSPAQVAAAPPPAQTRGGGRRMAHMAEGGLVLPQTPNIGTLPLTSAGADVDKTIGGFQGQEWYIAGRDYAASLVEGLNGLRNHSPSDKEKIKSFMAAGGEVGSTPGMSASDEAWCAHTVRSAFRQAGLGGALGGTNPAASSFNKWQQEVKPEDVQRGDVTTLYPTKERSGHVGIGTAPYNPASRNIPFGSGNTSTPGLPGQKPYWEGTTPQQGQGGAAAVADLPVGGPELGPNRLLSARRAVPPIHLRTPGPALSSPLAKTQSQEAATPIQVPIEPVVSTQAVMSARRQTARIANNFQSHAEAQHNRTAHGNPGHV